MIRTGSNTLVTVSRWVSGVVAPLVAPLVARVGALVGAVTIVVALAAVVTPLRAQKVRLRIQPHVGDTLRMKMEQHIEMCDDTVNGQTGSSMSAVMRIYTRAIAEHKDATSTAMRSITDSVTITPASAASFPMFAQTKQALEGRTVRLRVEQDGGIAVEGTGLAQHLPAVLPDKPVERGEVWTRDLSVPVSATHGSTGLVRVTFRFDSLAPDETIAYISMHGTFSHDHPNAKGDDPRDETSGTIEGTMQIDRRLEWMTDSRTTITLLSTVRKPPAPPVRVHMKITQAMRAMPRR
jgi:hypothetical protein